MADKRTLAKRNGQVKLVRALVTKGQGIMAGNEGSRDPKKEIAVLMKNVRTKKISIDELNENILNSVEPEEMEKEMEDSTDLDLLIDTEIEIMSEFIAKLNVRDNTEPMSVLPDEEQPPRVSDSPRAFASNNEQEINQDIDDNRSVRSSDNGRSSSVASARFMQRRQQLRLPKYDMKKFGGDAIGWPEFVESFRVSVHENTDLSDVERFTYLKSYLFGEAASCIQGLPLTSGNYFEAMKLLEDRFGNKQLIVSKHMGTLIDLPRVESSKQIKELRSTYDKIVVNIRALKAFDVASEQFGPMLSPVIMKMLPDDIKLEVSRRLGRDWRIDDLLDILGVEIKTREACSSNSRDEFRRNASQVKKGKENRENPPCTVESLAIGSKEIKCVFCEGGHQSDQCTVVSTLCQRKGFASNAWE